MNLKIFKDCLSVWLNRRIFSLVPQVDYGSVLVGGNIHYYLLLGILGIELRAGFYKGFFNGY